MKRGKVCETHQEFSPDGECRWCPTPPLRVFVGKLDVVDFTTGGGPLQIVSLPDPNIGPPRHQQPPPPILGCKHDGVLFDFSGVTSCAACGKVLQTVSAPLTIHNKACAIVKTPQAACTCYAP